MDAPVDGWTVFFGVAFISVATSGVAMALPTTPAPDTTAASNAIDKAAGSSYGATVEYEHNADKYWVGEKEFGLQNENGKAHGSISFGTMAPTAVGDERYERLEAVLNGEPWQNEFTNKTEFLNTVQDAQEAATSSDDPWVTASGTLRTRTIVVGDERVTIVQF